MTTYRSTEAATEAEIAQFNQMVEADRLRDIAPSANASGRKYVSAVTVDGKTEYSQKSYGKVMAEGFDPKFVEVNGMMTTRASYETMLQNGLLGPNDRVVDKAPHLSNGGQGASPFAPGADEGAKEEEATDAKKDAPSTDISALDKAIFADGQKALDAARDTLGRGGVDSLVQETIASGVAAVPPGVAPHQVEAVVKAYETSAKQMVFETGIDLQSMTAVLSERELTDARRAVVHGDVDGMQTLARRAADNLAALPAKDPAAWSEFMESRFPDVNYEIRNGHGWVEVEGRGMMAFVELVRGGYLLGAKIVKGGK